MIAGSLAVGRTVVSNARPLTHGYGSLWTFRKDSCSTVVDVPMDNVHCRLTFDLDNEIEIPGKNRK